MGLFDLFKPRDSVIKDRVLVTQKNRITSLERDVDDLKNLLSRKDGEIREVRTNYDRSKERMVDQIVELSDKFAGIQQDIMSVAHENGQLKTRIEFKEEPAKTSKKTSKKRKEKSKK